MYQLIKCSLYKNMDLGIVSSCEDLVVPVLGKQRQAELDFRSQPA